MIPTLSPNLIPRFPLIAPFHSQLLTWLSDFYVTYVDSHLINIHGVGSMGDLRWQQWARASVLGGQSVKDVFPEADVFFNRSGRGVGCVSPR